MRCGISGKVSDAKSSKSLRIISELFTNVYKNRWAAFGADRMEWERQSENDEGARCAKHF